MRYGELTRFALGGLWRQEVRTALTLVGVTVGTCALAFSLALGFGLRAFIDNEFKSREDFWRIIVHVDEPPPEPGDVPPERVAVKGDVSEDRRQRLREALVERYIQLRLRKAPVPLTPQTLATIAALPDVAEVRTYRSADAKATAAEAEKPAKGTAVAGPLAGLEPRLLAGRLPNGNGEKEVVVSELVLYDLGRGDDADLERSIGLPIKLEVGGVRNAPTLALARARTGRLPGDEMTAAQGEVLEKLVAALPGKLNLFNLTPPEQAELKRLLEAKHDPDEERPWESAATASDTYRVC